MNLALTLYLDFGMIVQNKNNIVNNFFIMRGNDGWILLNGEIGIKIEMIFRQDLPI